MNNYFFKIKCIVATFSFLVVGLTTGFDTFGQNNNTSERIFWTPYKDVNWKGIGYYDAMFHTHPGLGDEEYSPHETIDRYHEEGFKILTLAGHDYDIPSNHIESIYPWTKLHHIYEIIKNVENPTENNRTYGEMAKWQPYEDRDPVKLGMVSVEGCEVSAPHHIVSLFNSYSQGAKNEPESVKKIEDHGGIAYFAHPGRYVKDRGLTDQWYIDLYNRFDVLIGQAIYNRKDAYPEDRHLFDRITHKLGSERPIWLFGEDDMHNEKDLGWNRNVILLEDFKPGSMHPDIQDGSAPDVKRTLEKGYFYLWKPSKQYNKRSFNITDIEVSNYNINIKIDNNQLVTEIIWLTYNPDIAQTIAVHSGNNIDIKDLPEYCRFVRAEIKGDDGTIFTQPIYIKKITD